MVCKWADILTPRQKCPNNSLAKPPRYRKRETCKSKGIPLLVDSIFRGRDLGEPTSVLIDLFSVGKLSKSFEGIRGARFRLSARARARARDDGGARPRGRSPPRTGRAPPSRLLPERVPGRRGAGAPGRRGVGASGRRGVGASGRRARRDVAFRSLVLPKLRFRSVVHIYIRTRVASKPFSGIVWTLLVEV